MDPAACGPWSTTSRISVSLLNVGAGPYRKIARSSNRLESHRADSSQSLREAIPKPRDSMPPCWTAITYHSRESQCAGAADLTAEEAAAESADKDPGAQNPGRPMSSRFQRVASPCQPGPSAPGAGVRSAYHVDAQAHRTPAVQDAGGHDGAVFGEVPRRLSPSAMRA